jgi:hypothetical protein
MASFTPFPQEDVEVTNAVERVHNRRSDKIREKQSVNLTVSDGGFRLKLPTRPIVLR